MKFKICFFTICLILTGRLYAQNINNQPIKDTLQIVAVGDIMMGTMYPNGEYLPKNHDCSGSFVHIKPYLTNANVVFGNLEGALVRSTAGAKKCSNPNICYTFGMPAEFISCLTDAGFNLLSVANNHSGDFGDLGKKNTIETLTRAGIKYAGFVDCPTAIMEKDGVKYGFCAFAPNSGTVDVNNISQATQIVSNLKQQCDIVIVSFHAGAEGSSCQHVTRQKETFLGENRGNVYLFAHSMIDAGADVLLGHGPHVTRAVEIYKNRFIAYSMGNFSTFSRVNVQGVNGLAPIFRIFIDSNGTFIKAQITPTFQPSQDRTPRYDSEQRIIKIIRDLTKSDFPEVPTQINDKGEIFQ